MCHRGQRLALVSSAIALRHFVNQALSLNLEFIDSTRFGVCKSLGALQNNTLVCLTFRHGLII